MRSVTCVEKQYAGDNQGHKGMILVIFQVSTFVSTAGVGTGSRGQQVFFSRHRGNNTS